MIGRFVNRPYIKFFDFSPAGPWFIFDLLLPTDLPFDSIALPWYRIKGDNEQSERAGCYFEDDYIVVFVRKRRPRGVHEPQFSLKKYAALFLYSLLAAI